MHRTQNYGLIILLLLLLGIAGCERRHHLVQQHLIEFGTLIEITMISEDLLQAEQLLAEIERRLRQYRGYWHAWEDSELTRFNQELKLDGRAEIPASLEPLLLLSRDYYAASDGLFNPALGGLIEAAGFHGGSANHARAETIRQNLPGFEDLVLEEGVARSLNPHLQIDLGGIAKGYAIGLIANYLDQNGIENYIVNAGGDMQIAGNRLGRPWRIAIQNPFAPGAIATIEIDGKYSLFTSGNYVRNFRRGNEISHHIIDPRSGESARGQSSATVLTRNPVRADVAATTLMIDGLRNSVDLALSLGVKDFLVVGESRTLLASRSFAEKIELSVPWPLKIVN